MDLKNRQLILTVLVNESRFLQVGIRDAIDAASGTSLRGTLTLIRKELDRMEWEAYSIADSLGSNEDGLPPLSYLLTNGLCRIKLHFRSCDSAVAEVLIQNITMSMIRIQKAANQAAELRDPRVKLLIHRFFGCIYGSIRNLQSFL